MTARRLRLLRSLAVAATLAALVTPAVAAADPAGSETASSGTVKATLQWKKGPSYGGVTAPHLTITRSGTVTLDQDISNRDCSACSFMTGTQSRTTPLSIIDLDGDGEPEVVVDTYSGGAHCCYGALIYRFDNGTYTHINRLWGDVGASFKDLDNDGQPELVTVADVFAYAFTSYIDSWLPPLVTSYFAGKITDVTDKFGALVRKDMANILKQLPKARRAHRDLRGLVAAYVADLDTLGQKSAGVKFLAKERKNGDLGSNTRAKAFETALGKFLKKFGYT
jgi:hypothetical protein